MTGCPSPGALSWLEPTDESIDVVGVSGVTSQQDAQVAQAGVAALKQ